MKRIATIFVLLFAVLPAFGQNANSFKQQKSSQKQEEDRSRLNLGL